MPLWPVAAREARAAARAPRTYGWRAAVTAVGIAVIPISLWLSRAAPSQGRAVFVAIGIMAFIYCLFGGVLRTADAIAEEKRENTLGLLFLTDLKVADVLSGKLLASTATLFFGLLAMLPLLAIPVLLGGVSSRDLVHISLCLVNSLFYAISLGFLVSTFFRQGWVTISVGLAAMLGIIFFLPLIAGIFPPFIQYSLVTLSPGTMLGAVINTGSTYNFWQTLGVTHLVAWLNILFTAHFLPKFWQERPRSKRAEARFEKLRRLRFGGASTRKKFRTRLLNRNPLFWLSGREQVSSFGLMVFMIFLCGLSLISQWQQVIYALAAIHATLLVRMASAASHSLAEDRKSGALELLLATSLSVREVLKGRWMALGRQFFGPIIIAAMWHFFTIIWMGVMSPYANLSVILLVAAIPLIFAWITTGWYGMWMGLRARHPVAAIFGTLSAVLLVPLVIIGGVFSILAFFQLIPEYGFPGANNFEKIGFAAWAAYLIALSSWTAWRVKRAFREAAIDRFSDTQPIDWRPYWRITWKIAGATTLIFVAIWAYRAHVNSSGERALQKILAAHPTFSLKDPARPYIPEDKNLAYWDFLRSLNGAQPGYKGGRADAVKSLNGIIAYPWNPIGARLSAWRDGVRYSFQSYADGYWTTNLDAEFDRLHAAARERPYLRFNPNLSYKPMAWQGPELFYASLINVPRFLSARAEKRLSAGEHPLDDILLALRFANCVTNDSEAVGIRKEMLNTIIQPIYDGILDARWTDSELQEIQNAFSQLDAPGHFEIWRQRVARDAARAISERPAPSPWGPNFIAFGNMPYHIGNAQHRPRLAGKIQAAQANIIEAALGPTTSPIRRFQTWGRNPYDDESLEQTLTAIACITLDRSLMDLAQTQTAIDEVIVACAIERFRQAERKLPPTLADLTPKYLSAIPNDFMTGRPLIYRLTPAGYLLYSVGSNRIDDGGLPDTTETTKVRTKPIARDWPWIYAKP